MKIPPAPLSNILLVDDNRDGLLVRRLLLEELGYRVRVAPNAEEGLTAYQSGDFDIVVTDYKMPCMNGVQLIEQIRKVNPHARVILLSGFVDPLGLTEENTGADVVIAKSSNEPAHLTRWVRRLANQGTVRKPPSAQHRANARKRANVR